MTMLYKMIQKTDINYQHVVEIGVYKPETANTLGFIKEGTFCTLFEADPDTAKEIDKMFCKKYNVKIHSVALSSFKGTIKLYNAGASSFCETIDHSPAIAHDGKSKENLSHKEVQSEVFSTFDKGDIDILSIDIEGGEWDVINDMVSRPKVICIETQSRDYINPKIKELTQWLEDASYEIWFVDDTDTIFVKKGLVKYSLMLKIKRLLHSKRFFNGKLL
ncbi:MAG: FkbM family methyltransferase [Candidatus Ruthia sp.]|jgi:FkbM family methyltransferase|nr:FkbM family methyltransferase [Candidatus Ruthturnera sp.]